MEQTTLVEPLVVQRYALIEYIMRAQESDLKVLLQAAEAAGVELGTISTGTNEVINQAKLPSSLIVSTAEELRSRLASSEVQADRGEGTEARVLLEELNVRYRFAP